MSSQSRKISCVYCKGSTCMATNIDDFLVMWSENVQFKKIQIQSDRRKWIYNEIAWLIDPLSCKKSLIVHIPQCLREKVRIFLPDTKYSSFHQFSHYLDQIQPSEEFNLENIKNDKMN